MYDSLTILRLSKPNKIVFHFDFDDIVDTSFQDGMVEILQKSLQQYSGVSILRARNNGDDEGDDETSSEASKLFDKLLEVDTDAWDDEIKNGVASSDDLTTQKLTAEIQKTMVRERKLLILAVNFSSSTP